MNEGRLKRIEELSNAIRYACPPKPWHRRACPPKPWRRRALCGLEKEELIGDG